MEPPPPPTRFSQSFSLLHPGWTTNRYLYRDLYMHVRMYVCMYIFIWMGTAAASHALLTELLAFTPGLDDQQVQYRYRYHYMDACMYVCIYIYMYIYMDGDRRRLPRTPHRASRLYTRAGRPTGIYIEIVIWMHVCMYAYIYMYIYMDGDRRRLPRPSHRAARFYTRAGGTCIERSLYVCMHVCTYAQIYRYIYMHLALDRNGCRLPRVSHRAARFYTRAGGTYIERSLYVCMCVCVYIYTCILLCMGSAAASHALLAYTPGLDDQQVLIYRDRYVYVYMYVCIYMHLVLYMCVCIYVYNIIYIYVYMYIYAYRVARFYTRAGRPACTYI